MTGFEPWTSGVGSDRSANWATPLPITYYFLLCLHVEVHPTIDDYLIYYTCITIVKTLFCSNPFIQLIHDAIFMWCFGNARRSRRYTIWTPAQILVDHLYCFYCYINLESASILGYLNSDLSNPYKVSFNWSFFLKNGQIPASFSFISVFSNTHYKFFNKKYTSSIWCRDSNSQPLDMSLLP